jgi:predicted CXXCH cytochrome family protein
MFERLMLTGILLCPMVALTGQDIDANLSVRNRSPSTVAGQITDPEERRAFVTLFQLAPPSEMLRQANAFLTHFPQSAFLAQAYDVAARAHFDLGNYGAGLESAEQSLSLLPENPILLVSVADVEAREHRNRAAISHAQDALDDLDRFTAPGSVDRGTWPDLKRQLQARAHFAMGRALLTQALDRPPGDQRAGLLHNCKASLVEAQGLNPTDVEVTYLLGLAHLAAQEPLLAADALAVVYEGHSEFASQAEQDLRAIHRALKLNPPVAFNVFVKQAAERGRPRLPGQDRQASSNRDNHTQVLPGYAGSRSCQTCHVDIYQQWSQTGMARMLRPYAPQNVIGDFENNNEVFFGDQAQYGAGKLEVTRDPTRALFARMLMRDGRHYFEIHEPDGNSHTYPVDYTIGSKFQQAYATRLPNGQIHVFPVQFSALQKRWINYWQIIDASGSERADLRSWEKLDASTSYQAVCAVCHTSQLKNIRGGGFTVDDVEFREPGIDCEMCHGPSETHAVEMSLGERYPKPALAPPVNFYEVGTRDSVRICAQCHMQSAVRTPGSGGELNYVRFGWFAPENPSIPFGEFSRKGFYKDGRFRQTTFIVEAMERSKCFRSGQLSCSTCHDPHGHDAASNLTSLKWREQPDLMCTGCHSRFTKVAVLVAHTRHSAGSEASRCVSCHMPRIMEAVLFRARTHQIDDIPNAQMTERFGQEESPNACLLCHSDKGVGWLQHELQAWKPGD